MTFYKAINVIRIRVKEGMKLTSIAQNFGVSHTRLSVRLQGVSKSAYWLYVLFDAMQKTDR